MNYFEKRLSSKGHTPIYKIHKYFARRPHNQFRAIIEHYVPPGGVVLDCFAGGGVTLIEALSSGRKAVAVDVNPMASLIQHAEVAEVDSKSINEISTQMAETVQKEIGAYFKTDCRKCDQATPYRWIERAYEVVCKECHTITLLDEKSKFKDGSGRAKNGHYSCVNCATSFASVSTRRVGSVILNVRYRCTTCDFEETAAPLESDFAKDLEFRKIEPNLLEKFILRIPSDPIPMEWDRQAEDALSRKGFDTFADLFSPRNRVFLAFMFKQLSGRKELLDDDLYVALLTQLSALIRYVNVMTFSTSSWMDGRPVAWAKHAYWTPNQFIEVNPFEYLGHRQSAVTKWETDRKSRFAGKKQSIKPLAVINDNADYSIVCGDSRFIDLPNKSIDAVVTDPPFGGNIQYGELSHFWQVWLGDSNPYQRELFNLAPEILVHRKKREESKTNADYQAGLEQVFAECYRVLKDEGVLTFTFNNTNPGAWFSIMKAAHDAGFSLEDQGVFYIEEIKAYRDTAHLRFDSELQGDVLYTFVKIRHPIAKENSDPQKPEEWLADYANRNLRKSNDATSATDLHLALVRRAYSAIESGFDDAVALDWLNLLGVISKANKSEMTLFEICERLIHAQ